MVMVLCQDTEHIVSAGKFFVSTYSFFVRDRRKRCKKFVGIGYSGALEF